MKRFFLHTDSISGETVFLTGSDVHHIRDVLRLKTGDRIVAIDESAAEHEVEIESIDGDRLKGRILLTRRPNIPRIELGLFQGLPKGTKFDTIVEKATELGADHIAPVIMERSVARPDTAGGARVERWRRIAEAAAKQSRRPTLPRVDPPLDWPALLAALGEYDLTVVFWEGATEPPDRALSGFSGQNLAVIIGPEGGFAATEIEALLNRGAKTARLGPRILRTETAPIAALAIVNFLLER